MTTRPDRKTRMEQALTAAFQPITLVVEDDSHRHAGHAGAHADGETHYNVAVVAAAFQGKNRVERHRMVNAALAAEFQSGLHALAVTAKAPGE